MGVEYQNAGAALGAGLNTGANFAGKVIGASRERQQHSEDQSSRQANAASVDASVDPTAQPDPQDASAHMGFLSQLGTSLKAAGQGIEGFFGGQGKPALPPGATGAPPASALPPQPAAPPGGAIATGAGIPAQAVQVPQGVPGAPTANVGGGVAMMAEGGPVDYPNPGAALGAGLNSGADFAGKVTGAAREREQHGLDQADRQSVAQYAAGAAGAPPGATDASSQPGAPPVQPDTQSAQGAAQNVSTAGAAPLPPTAQSHVDHIESFAGHLKDGALSDDGTPGGTAAIPPPGGPQTALASAAQNPAAAKGIPERGDTAVPASATTGDKPVHSLTPDYWDKSDQLLAKAVHAAALAGHDPDATFTALSHMRTSFIQGHMLRNLSAANVALQNGDTKGVETALHNMNYYLPNGQNLNIQKDDQGNIVYQNALQPYLDSKGQPTEDKQSPGLDGKMATNQPNMIPVDAAHLQMLGQAVLDPMKVNDVLMSARSAGAKQALERAQAQGALAAGQGALMRGGAAISDAAVREKLAPSQIFQNTAHATYWAQKASEAAKNGAGAKPDPLSYKAGTDASKAVYDLFQGIPQTAPAMSPRVDKTGKPVLGPDGKQVQDPSMAPNAGKTFRDPSLTPSWLKGKSPDQLGQIASLAGEIGAGNQGKIPPQKAAEIAGRIYSHQGQTHVDPVTKKPSADVKFSKDRTQGWVWNGTGWDNFALTKRTGSSLAGGNVDTVEPYDGATGPSQQGADSLTPDNPMDNHIPQDAPDPDDDKEAE